MPDNRAKYIATVLQAVILGAVTYYGVKWLVDAMDPTKKNRLAAQKQVGTCLLDTQEAGVNIGTCCRTIPILGQLRRRLQSLEENLVKRNPAYSFDSISRLESSDRLLSGSICAFRRQKTCHSYSTKKIVPKCT